MHEAFFPYSDECERWKQCCEAAQECCDTQLGTAHVNGDGRHCLRTWDGFGCWQDTAPNSHVYNPCPSFIQHAMPSSKIWYTYCCNVINSVKIYLYSSLLTVSLKKQPMLLNFSYPSIFFQLGVLLNNAFGILQGLGCWIIYTEMLYGHYHFKNENTSRSWRPHYTHLYLHYFFLKRRLKN